MQIKGEDAVKITTFFKNLKIHVINMQHVMMNNACMTEHHRRLINWTHLTYIPVFFSKRVIKLANYVNNRCIPGNEFITKLNSPVFRRSRKTDISEPRLEKLAFPKVRGIIFTS